MRRFNAITVSLQIMVAYIHTLHFSQRYVDGTVIKKRWADHIMQPMFGFVIVNATEL